MTAEAVEPTVRAPVAEAAEAACRRIAPSWPLDRFIAVNPYWGWLATPMPELDARLAHLGGSTLTMPRRYYRDAWQAGRIGRQDLEEAIRETGSGNSPDSLVEALDDPDPIVHRLPLLSDLLDARRDLSHEPAWADAIVQQISQFCAKFFDADQAEWPLAPRSGLYTDWRDTLTHNHAVSLLMGTSAVQRRAPGLPPDPWAAIEAAVEALGLPDDQLEELFVTALMRIHGWASWAAYRDWQAGDDRSATGWRIELLATRLAWELLLDDGERAPGSIWAEWHRGWQRAARPAVDAPVWHWQRALEIAYQKPLAARLAGPATPPPSAPPRAQAVFCIDVRSEPFRRALENADPAIETLGFAGFFGVPAAYRPAGTTTATPALPGLLAPSLEITDTCGDADSDEALSQGRQSSLAAHSNERPFHRLPGSAFTLVETIGLKYLWPLLKRSLASLKPRRDPTVEALNGAATPCRPRLVLPGEEGLERKLDLAEAVLAGMSLRRRFARVIALIGHGSQSANNPHAAGLECGACSGQAGDINARALAAMLNEQPVREGLAQRGWSIPETTRFVAGLHNTTTDEVTLLDTDELPGTHGRDLARLRTSLEEAGRGTRAERAPGLDLGHLVNTPERLYRALRRRGNDWAQTRPEWGLADNAALIVAPRNRTRGLDLGGQAFLHEYDAHQDRHGQVLEQIMTAPMVVAHWINMQYYASTVDHRRYGSGNKVLHNVVAGRIGVFEGNAGDLRIGLAYQSLHDGAQWRHTPRRLAVYIEAPRHTIERVINDHALVQNLVTRGWVHLFRIDPESGAVSRYGADGWSAWVAADTAASEPEPA
jgi:uncharacterized protein YbcC (UPF0753/DUF2309 family)